MSVDGEGRPADRIRGGVHEALAHETGETFNPEKNPYIRSGLVKLLDRRARPPKMDYSCAGAELPGWSYPDENGLEAGTD